MAATRTRGADRPTLLDQRRSTDRRGAPRNGAGTARGRRATDAAEGDSNLPAARSGASARKRRATRDGREPLVIYLRPESIKALKMEALENDTTASAIMSEALDAWFRARGGRAARR